MSEVSISPAERSRKAFATVLQRLQEPGRGVAIAAILGVSESTASRIKTDKLEDSVIYLYALGFKLVSEEKVCVNRDELQMLRRHYARSVQNEQLANAMMEME